MGGSVRKIGIVSAFAIVVGLIIALGINADNNADLLSSTYSANSALSTPEQVSTSTNTPATAPSKTQEPTTSSTKTTADPKAPSLVTVPLASLLPVRDDIGTRYKISAAENTTKVHGLGDNLTEIDGAKEAISQEYTLEYGYQYVTVTIVRFDTIENALKPYEVFTSQLYAEGGFTQANVDSINAECFGKYTGGTTTQRNGDIYCVKSNIYYYVYSNIGFDTGLDFAEIITDKLEAQTGLYVENKKTYTNTEYGYSVDYPEWWDGVEGFQTAETRYDIHFNTGSFLSGEAYIVSESYAALGYDRYIDGFRDRIHAGGITVTGERSEMVGDNRVYVFEIEKRDMLTVQGEIVIFTKGDVATYLLYVEGGSQTDSYTWLDRMVATFTYL